MHSYLHEVDLQAALKHLYRESRTALERTVAKALFWYWRAQVVRDRQEERPRFAPILSCCLSTSAQAGAMGYVIRSRERETSRSTLVELLKQQFGIT